ncbi:MAG: hypothetical protein IPM42_21075 [Saprospiraceae bacterium]|nr:hypothetical protein [Saprospiraceae bacterium]
MSNSYDDETTLVCKYLMIKNKIFIRIDSTLDLVYLKFANFFDQSALISINGNDYFAQQFEMIWYRKGRLLSPIDIEIKNKDITIYDFLCSELDCIENWFWSLNLNFFGNYKFRHFDKLNILNVLRINNIDFPEGWIISERSKLIELHKEFSIITKVISEPLKATNSHEDFLHLYTTEIYEKHIEIVTESNFRSSFCQKTISSDYEIRCVFLGLEFYGLVFIKDKLEIDLRKSNYKDKYFIINLPQKLKKNLLNLFKDMNLKFCTFDMIVKNNKYYMLDINPCGKFGFLSTKGNFNIEFKISELLLNGRT